MNLPVWLRRLLGNEKSESYKVLVAPAEEGTPYPNPRSEDDALAADHLFTQVPAIYAATSAIAASMAMVPIRVEGPDGQERPKHPLANLLRAPNPLDTCYDLIEQTAIFLELTGTCPWLLEGGKAKMGGPPDEIVVLHPNNVRPIADKRTKIGGFRYTMNGQFMQFAPEEIIYFKMFDPSDTKGLNGIGSVTPAIHAATVDRMASKFNENFFQRGAVLSGVLETDNEDITPDIMAKYAAKFRDEFSGWKNSWQVKGLSHGLKWKPTQISHNEMMFSALRSSNREEMLMSQGVPPIMVTLMDGATYSNAQQQDYAFWVSTILPKLRKLEARLNANLASRWNDGTILRFDVTDIRALQPDRTQIMQTVTQAIERRILTRNEARYFLGTGRVPKLDAVPDGDEFLTNFQITTLAGAIDIDTPATPEVVPDDAADQVENLFKQLDAAAEKVLADERRDAHKRGMVELEQAVGRVFFRVTREMLVKQYEAMIAYVEEHPQDSFPAKQSADDLSTILAAIEDDYRDQLTGVYHQATVQAGQAAAAALPFDFTYTSGSLAAIQFSQTQSGLLITNLHATTLKVFQNVLAQGLADSLSGLELQSAIGEALGPQVSAERARLIAITESNKSLNFGTLDSWKQTDGVVGRKAWSTSQDEKVRDTHAAADGQVVGLNDQFEVGGSVMDHPGDTSHGADVAEVANCRCAMEPVLSSEENYEAAGLSQDDSARRGHDEGTPPGRNGNGKQGGSSVVAGRNGSSQEER